MVRPEVITRVNARDADPPPLSVTLTVKWYVPVAVGVPAIAPPELSERPKGKEPAVIAQVNPVPVPPEAANVCEYGAEAAPLGNVAPVVMLGPAMTVSERLCGAEVTERLSVT
jgi:hypothetical protein